MSTPEVRARPGGGLVEGQDLSRRGFGLGLAVVLGLAAVYRVTWIVLGGFPLHDGGLFLVMMRDVVANGFRLPELSSYNLGDIPFAYPPLGMYLGAGLDRLTPLDGFDVLRALPLTFSLLSLGAFAALARAVMPSRAAALVAVWAFAFLPRSYMWMLMGGGLTRGLGLLFALLATYSGYRLFRGRDGRYVIATAVFASLTVLSHLEMTFLLAGTLGVLLVAGGPSRRAVAHAALVGAITLVATSPWWLMVVARHGLATLLAPIGSRQLISAESATILGRFDITNEPLFPMLAFLGGLGLLWCLGSRQFLLPAWLVALGASAPWVLPTQVLVPLAMLIGLGATRLLIPMLLAGLAPRGGDLEGATARMWQHPATWGAAGLASMALFTLITSAVSPPRVMDTVSAEQRSALEWAGANTPEGSRFVVIEAAPWWADRVGEWAPALSARASVATPQGREWVAGEAFGDLIEAYDGAQLCAGRDAACLVEWSRREGIPFTHVLVVKETLEDPDDERNCCWALRRSLERGDEGASVIYDREGATIASLEPGRP